MSANELAGCIFFKADSARLVGCFESTAFICLGRPCDGSKNLIVDLFLLAPLNLSFELIEILAIVNDCHISDADSVEDVALVIVVVVSSAAASTYAAAAKGEDDGHGDCEEDESNE